MSTSQHCSRTGVQAVLGCWLLLALALDARAQPPPLQLPHSVTLSMTGTSTTLLPDGQWLVLGGETTTGPVATARMYDPVRQTPRTLDEELLHARAYHTATLLADGHVLILGGEGKDGIPVTTAELFNPETAMFQTLSDLGLIARTHHGATLLADGRLLITGGRNARGTVLATAELFNPFSSEVTRFYATLGTARLSHTATLLPNHQVLIWGGMDTDGAPVVGAELYDPQTHRFLPYDAASTNLAFATLTRSKPPVLLDSEPSNGETTIAVDTILSLRFSKPVAVTSLNTETVVLIGPDGHTPVRVTPIENGLVAFVRPSHELLPSADYTLVVRGVVDEQHQPLDWVTIGFKTQALGQPSLSAAASTRDPDSGSSSPFSASSPSGAETPMDQGQRHDATSDLGPTGKEASTTIEEALRSAEAAATEDGEAWTPGPLQWEGHWRTGRPLPEAVMALLDYEEPTRKQIAHLRARQRENETGPSATPGVRSLVDDPTVTGVGGTVLKLNDQPLAGVTVSLEHRSVRTDEAGRFVLTAIPAGHHELVVDGRTVPGGREYLHVIFGVEVRPHGLTELTHAVYLPRVQPSDWVTLPSPTQTDTAIHHPNWPDVEILHTPKDTVFRDREGKILTRIALVPVPLDRAPYPTPAAFPMYFMLHPGGVLVQGLNTRGVQTFYPNTMHEPPGTEHSLWVYDSRGAGWTVYGKGQVNSEGSYIEPEAGAGLHEHMGAGHSLPTGKLPPVNAPGPCGGSWDGDPVDCATGLFLHTRTDVTLEDDIPLTLTRTYRPGDNTVRAFGKGTNHVYGMYLRNPQSGSRELIDLILPDGGRVRFPHTGGTVLHTDYVWTHTETPSSFYGAQITAPVLPGEGERWYLRLKDGTLYVFSSITGLLQQVVDRNDNRLFLTYSGGQILRITTPNGRYSNFQYDTLGRITTIRDLLGRTWSYQYDAAGYLARATYPDATFEAYTYNSPQFAGAMDTVRDRRGTIMVRNTYDTNGRVIRQTMADGGIYQFAYTVDAGGKVTRSEVTDPRGQIRRREFNAAGYLTRMTRGLNSPLAQVETYQRNVNNLLTKITDALGRVTEYQYDAKGNVTKVTRMFGTASATPWTYTYEPVYSLLKSATDPLGHTTTLTYDGLGNLRQVTDPLTNKSTFTYDTLGRPVTATSYIGASPLTTTFTYDGPDLVQVKDPLGRLVTLTPDVVGRILAIRDPIGRLSSAVYDALDRVTTQLDPQGSSTRYAYDGNGNLLTFTDSKNQGTRFAYDLRDRVLSKTDALGRVESYRYDATGNLIFLTDRKGQVSGYTYDTLNRLVKASYGATSTTAPVYTSSTNYFYDKGNRLSLVQDSLAGNITHAYDPRFDTITQEAGPEGTVNYSYYANGLRRTMAPTGGTTITYGYDATNRLTSISQAAGVGGGPIPSTVQTVAMGYDTVDRQTSLRLPNGIQITYGYDTASQLTSITYKKANGTVIGNLTYTYDANGQRLATGGSLAASGLPKAFGVAQYDGNNRLTKLDAVTYTYDNNGNLLGDGANTYTWNARDQLVAISGANAATYTYDGLGRRRKGTAYTTVYDGWNPIQLKSGAAVVENRLTGLGLDTYYARMRGGVVETYLTDILGSTVQLSNQAQNPVASYLYDPYGGTAGTANSNVVKYTGREQDFADLYYYRNRYYKPSIGRFISEDPIGLASGDANLYRYVHNDPVSRIDPSGLADLNFYIPFKDGALYGFAEVYNLPKAIVVAGHGSPGAFGNFFGTYTAAELALKIRRLKKYKAGMPVQLTGCYTGEPGALVPGPVDPQSGIGGFLPVYAQQLANELGTTVLAPSGSFHVESKSEGYNASITNRDGSPGRFVPYYPKVPLSPASVSPTPSWGSYNHGPGGPFYAVSP